MKDLAPDIVRKRLLVEGYFTPYLTQQDVEKFLLQSAAHLDLRTYGAPIVFAPSSGMGKDDNAGYDGFIPLIDSGISIYVWSKAKFFSALFYTCKEFDTEKACDFCKDYFKVDGEIAFKEF